MSLTYVMLINDVKPPQIHGNSLIQAIFSSGREDNLGNIYSTN